MSPLKKREAEKTKMKQKSQVVGEGKVNLGIRKMSK